MSASIFFCGDIINMYSRHQFVGAELQKIIKGCDFAVGNLEGVLNDLGTESRPMIQDSSTITSLKEAGFTLLLLANNHIADYGRYRFAQTIRIIKDNGMRYIGAGLSYQEAYMPLILKINDVKIAIINICEASVGQWDYQCKDFGFAWIGDINLSERLISIKKDVDYLVVCVHAGLEHKTLPLPYFRDYYRALCDMGADCIIGAHPHIVQGIEQYASSLIFYSLGNFFFPRSPEAGMEDVENTAFSCVINFSKGRPLEYKLIHHGIENLIVDTLEEPKWRVDELSDLLSSPQYEENIFRIIHETYKGLVRSQLSYSMMGTEASDTLITKIKFIIKYLFTDYNQNRLQRDLLLRRLVLNETYRSIIDSETKYSVDNR